jgi:hypothetical protein
MLKKIIKNIADKITAILKLICNNDVSYQLFYYNTSLGFFNVDGEKTHEIQNIYVLVLLLDRVGNNESLVEVVKIASLSEVDSEKKNLEKVSSYFWVGRTLVVNNKNLYKSKLQTIPKTLSECKIDAILEKINETGIKSLNKVEKLYLEINK